MLAFRIVGSLVLSVAALSATPSIGASGPDTGGPDTAPVVAVDVSAGYWHSCAVTNDGRVLCWGENISGQIGDGTRAYRPVPTEVVGLDHKIVSVTTGTYHTCALTSSGHVKCWGSNASGQLGDGTTQLRRRPVDVVGLADHVTEVSALGHFTCALTVAGEVWCWGSNWAHELGDGSSVGHRTHPVQVAGLESRVTRLSAGVSHSCALLVTGRVQCWGYGLLGDGKRTAGSTAVMVKRTDDAVDVAAGLSHTCVVRSNGSVWCWGFNRYGFLGDGTTRDQLVPVPVLGHSAGVSRVSTGWDHSCAVTSTGQAQCWGARWTGDGTIRNRLEPVNVVGVGQGVEHISMGNGGGCVLTQTGAARCWGPRATTGRQRFDCPTVPVTVVGLTGTPVAHYQPDLEISAHRDGGYRGNDVYNRSGDQQSRSIHVSPRHTVATWIRISNDGELRDVVVLGSGIHAEAHARLQVRAFSGGREITNPVQWDEFWTRVAPEERRSIRVTVRIPRDAHYLDEYHVRVSAISAHDPSKIDVVTIGVLTLSED